jgi:hypothetical protein
MHRPADLEPDGPASFQPARPAVRRVGLPSGVQFSCQRPALDCRCADGASLLDSQAAEPDGCRYFEQHARVGGLGPDEKEGLLAEPFSFSTAAVAYAFS